MTIVYVLSGITLAAVLAALAIAVVSLQRQKKEGGVTQNPEEMQRFLDAAIGELAQRQAREFRDIANNVINTSTSAQLGTLGSMMETRLNNQNGLIDGKLREIREENERLKANVSVALENIHSVNDKLKESVAAALENIRQANEVQFAAIRTTVDEKLQTSIASHFTESFGIISQRMKDLEKGFEDMQGLDEKLKNLNKLFSNVKTRGTWGEVSLEALIGQILTTEQYKAQYTYKKNPDENTARVDFAILMPGKGEQEVYLPVDSKFPTEDYQKLVEAADSADKDRVEVCRKAYIASVDKCARDINKLYLKPPLTTDFGILYVPVEGMFDEIARVPGYIEKLQRELRIVVAGPTTFAALINSLKMGFRTVALEKSSEEIRKSFEQFVKDFRNFSMLLDRARTQLGTVAKTIDSADNRTVLIRKRLAKYSGEQTGEDFDEDTQKLLAEAAADNLDDEGSEDE